MEFLLAHLSTRPRHSIARGTCLLSRMQIICLVLSLHAGVMLTVLQARSGIKGQKPVKL